MKFKFNEIKAKTKVGLETEVIFEIASARALGIELLRLDITSDDKERLAGYAEKKLRSLKRLGRIQLFVLASDIKNNSTEAEYLKNKYPSIGDLIGNFEFSYFVKI